MDLMGAVLLDKPGGISSFEAIERVKRMVGVRKAGHVGTLDPLATGLLLVCLGKATKLVQFLVGWDKEYLAKIKLGVSTETWDREGGVLASEPPPEIHLSQLEKAVKSLTGEVTLLAPEYSALKFQGKRLYQYARAGEIVPKRETKVKIYKAEIVGFDSPYVDVVLACSKGTYVRSFAFELGRILECGATLWELKRTKLGPYGIERALSTEQIQELTAQKRLEEHLISTYDILSHLPRVILGENGYEKVKHGIVFSAEDVAQFDSFQKDRWVRILDPEMQLLAVGRSLADSTLLTDSPLSALIRYERVLVN